jgi:hypothetical protein
MTIEPKIGRRFFFQKEKNKENPWEITSLYMR